MITPIPRVQGSSATKTESSVAQGGWTSDWSSSTWIVGVIAWRTKKTANASPRVISRYRARGVRTWKPRSRETGPEGL